MKKSTLAKLLSLLLACVMLVSIAGCTPTEETEPPVETGDDTLGYDIFDSVEPLQTPVDMKIAGISGSTAYYQLVLLEDLGLLDKVGINVTEFEYFAGGPAMLEAMAGDQWTLGAMGIGGMIPGVINYDIKILCALQYDDGAIQMWAANDTDVVKAGKNTTPSGYEVYGDEESWKNVEIYCPAGNTQTYALSKVLAEYGLTINDINFNSMDQKNSYTALIADQIKVGAVSGKSCFESVLLDGEFTQLYSARGVDCELYNCLVANPDHFNDPDMKAAIDKIIELHWLVMEWQEENWDTYFDMYCTYFESIGIETAPEVLAQLHETDPVPTLEFQYEKITTKTNGETSDWLMSFFNIMDFYVGLGNYTAEQGETFKNSGAFITECVTDYYAA